MWSSLIKSGGDVRSLAERFTRPDEEEDPSRHGSEASHYESESYYEGDDGEAESQTTYDDEAEPEHHEEKQAPGTQSGLLGGLSRFLETMAPPPEQDGWDEDDDYIDEDDIGFVDMNGDERAVPDQHSHSAAHDEAAVEDGWDDEDALNVDDDPPEHDPVYDEKLEYSNGPVDANFAQDETVVANGWDEEDPLEDVNVDDVPTEPTVDDNHADVDERPEHSSYPEDSQYYEQEDSQRYDQDEAPASDGWDEEGLLDDVNVDDDNQEDPVDESLSNGAGYVDESEPPLVEEPVDDEAGGWDEDEGALDLIDESARAEDDLAQQGTEEDEYEIPAEAAEAHHTLQTALDDLHDQEDVFETGTNSPSQLSDDALTDDEAHASAAVLEIQQEMDLMRAASDHKPESESATPVVDHTPDWHTNDGNTTRSLLVTADDLTLEMGTVGNDLADSADVYADENEDEFGPVVDHLPKPPHHRGTSVDAQARSIVGKDIYDDEAMDESCVTDGWEDDDEAVSQALKEDNKVVDVTPVDEQHRAVETDRSLGVVASETGSTLRDPEDQDTPEGFGPVVDHTPTVLTSPSVHSTTTGANSMAVNVAALAQDIQDYSVMDETCFGDSTVDDGRTTLGDGWEDDEDGVLDDDEGECDTSDRNEDPPTPISSTKKKSSFARPRRHVVDHTPSEMPASEQPMLHADRSVLALAAIEDLSRDTGEGNDETVYDDENEMAYGPVVDHTPMTPAMSTNGPSDVMSAAAHASTVADDLRTEFDDNTSMYGQSTIGGDGAVSVLDGGVSVFANTVDGLAGDGWDQDDVVLDEEEEPVEEEPDLVDHTPPAPPPTENVALVDQTPSEMGTPRPAVADPSVEVAVSDDQTKASADENDDFGPIVDHTPNTPAQSLNPLREDSVVAQAALADLDTVDEETLAGGESIDRDEDTVDESLPSIRRLDPALDRQVVDHVPNRPEPRYGDASTAVAADPSEVLSEVDDMGLEDNFGPVVDLTPPNRPPAVSMGLPSAAGSTMGAGSTVVFAPSVVADDLDQDETEAQGDGWDHEDEPEVEEEPNPQSGNDEPLPPPPEEDNEPLVDFLPPPQEVPNEVVAREGLSVVTVGGGQSLVPAEEVKEDDFGPVVDQTPRGHPSAGRSHASTESQVTMSEIRAMEKEDKAQEADETSTDTEPTKPKVVVDHLPQMRDKIQADSLATVARSQLSDGDDEEDEDERFGPVVDHLPTPHALSSRGGSTVDALATVSEVDSDEGGADGDGWDEDADLDVSVGAVSDGTALQNAAATRAAFTRSTSTASEDRTMSVRFDSSVHESTTIASVSESNDRTFYFDTANETSGNADETRYFDTQDQSTSGIDENGWEDDDIVIEENSIPLKDEGSFADADTPPSTPYRRGITGDTEALTVHELSGALNRLSDDDNHEDPASKAFANVTGASCQTCAEARTIDCPCVKRLVQANTSNGGSMIGKMVTPEGGTIEVDFNQLLQDEIVKRRLIEEQSKTLRASFGPERLQEMKRLETTMLEMKRQSHFSTKEIADLRDECATLRLEKGMLDEQLKESTTAIATLEAAKGNVASRELDLTEQVRRLKLALDDEAPTGVSSDTEEITTLRKSLETATSENEQLKSTVVELSKSLSQSEEHQSAQSREFGRCSAELNDAVSEVQMKLLESERQLTDSKTSSELAQKSYEEKVKSLEALVSSLQMTNEKLVQEKETERRQHAESLQKQSEIIETKAEDVQNLESTVAALAKEKEGLQVDLDHQRDLAERSESLITSVRELESQKDALQSSLIESKETVLSLQKHIDEHGMEEEARDSKKDTEIAALQAELKEVKAALASKESEKGYFVDRLGQLTAEKEGLNQKVQKLNETRRLLESKAEASKLSAAREHQKLTQELESLRKEFDQVQTDRARLQSEHQKSTSHLASLGRTLKLAEQNAQQLEGKYHDLEEQSRETQAELASTRAARDSAVTELDQNREQCRLLEKDNSRLQAEMQRQTQSASDRFEGEFATLRAERDDFKNQVASFASISEELERQQAQLLEVVSERDLLAEENEEMLVQFGLLKQQMDESAEQVRSLQDDMATARNAENGTTEAQRELFKLQRSHSELSAYVEDLLSKNSTLREQMEASGAEIERLTKDLEVVNSYNEEYASRNDAMDGQLAELSSERDTLLHQVKELSSSVAELQRQRDSAQEEHARQSEQMRELSSRVAQLSSQHADLQRQLAFSMEEKKQLNERVHFLESQNGKATSWNKEKEHLVSVSNNLEARCRALDNECRAKEGEIAEMKERIRHSEAEYHGRLGHLERESTEKDRVIAWKEKQLFELGESTRVEVSGSQSEINGLRGAAADAEQKVRLLETQIYEADEKNAGLSRDLRSAQEQLRNAMAEGTRVKEMELKRLTDELEALKRAKAHEIARLSAELASIKQSLHATKDELSLREEEAERLSNELTELRSQLRKDTASVANVLKTSPAELEDVDTMRGFVVSLAEALERSENRRAESMDRLLTERQANADSLRRLSESVKRFYSTVTFGDS